MSSGKQITFQVVSILLLIFIASGCSKKEDNGNPVGPEFNLTVLWEPVGEIPYEENYTRIDALSVLSDNTLFAGGDCGIYRSADRGNTWTTVNTGLPIPPVYPNIRSIGKNGSDQLFAGSSQVFKSTNKGGQWAVKTGEETLDRINVIALTSDQALFAAAGWSGVYRSTDTGETWNAVNQGLEDENVETLVIDAGDVIYIGVADSEGNHVFRSGNRGESWTKAATLESFINVLAVNASGDLFAGTADGMFRSEDHGNTWSPINAGFPWEPWVLDILILDSGPVFIGTTDGAFMSPDNGETWQDISDGFTEHVTAVLSLAVSPDGYLYAGTRFSGVFRSRDRVIP